MKKLLFLILLIFPTVAFTSDLFDPQTGTIYMPHVVVGTDTYSVEMTHQGNLVFKVSKIDPVTSLSGTSWIRKKSIDNVGILTFIDDTYYSLSHSKNTETNIAATSELGTYTWNSKTNEFVATGVISESDGNGGLYNASNPADQKNETIEIIGDQLIFHDDNEGDEILNRVK